MLRSTWRWSQIAFHNAQARRPHTASQHPSLHGRAHVAPGKITVRDTATLTNDSERVLRVARARGKHASEDELPGRHTPRISPITILTFVLSLVGFTPLSSPTTSPRAMIRNPKKNLRILETDLIPVALTSLRKKPIKAKKKKEALYPSRGIPPLVQTDNFAARIRN